MLKEQAITLMKRGVKITHPEFNNYDWIASSEDGTIYSDSNNQIISAKIFWQNHNENKWCLGWKTFEEVESGVDLNTEYNSIKKAKMVELKSQDQFEEETALERYFDVSEAIGYHLNNKFPVPIDWIDERNELIEKIEEIRKRTNTHAI